MKTGLSIYDTKSRSVQPIEITNAEYVRIYCCGPTVYRDAHVGNFRTFMLTDLVVRTLHFRGIRTFTIQNITDVGHMSEDVIGTETIESNEDKVLAQAIKEKSDPFSIAKEYERKFHLDLARLNITRADTYPKASDSIALMQDLIEMLIANGNAYVANENSVYFAAKTFESYGAISGNDLSALKPGYRFDYTDDRSKRFHADWALWKSAEQRTEMVWPSKWGMGFPGWHIECSAMSLHFLNQHIDLHIGGSDLRFPHHENERAQSNSAIGNVEAVALWLHGEHLLFEGKKMSKSSGNVLLVSEVIERGFDPLALRLCFLENRYRSQMDLTWAAIEAAHNTILRWRNKMAGWLAESGRELESDANPNQELAEEEIEFIVACLETDLDTPRALLRLRVLERNENIHSQIRYQIFLTIDQLLGLNLKSENIEPIELTSNIQELLHDREIARTNKDFTKSDEIRDLLLQLKISVTDTQSGQRWETLF